MAYKKIMKKERISTYLEFEVGLDTLIEHLQDLKETYSGHQNLRIEKEWNYDESDSYELWGDREETDEEFDRRIRKLEKEKITKKTLKVKAEEEQYNTFLFLKEKYEGGKV